MTIRESILSAINTRQFTRVAFTDNSGRLRTDVLEGYTLGLDSHGKEFLKGFYWASDPGPWYSSGARTYPTERIIAVDSLGYQFGLPHDENNARDFSGLIHIFSSYYFPSLPASRS